MLELKDIYLNSLEDERVALDRINAAETPEIQSQSDKEMLWYYNENIGLADFFLNSDIEACKQRFYTCARLDEYLIENYDSRILDSGINHITYALLCDDKDLIARYANLGHKVYMWMVEHGHSTLLYCIQQIMKYDWERVKWSIGIMKTRNLKMAKAIQPDLRFFEGILEKDEIKMHEAIIQLLKDHKKRNKHMGVSQYYISIPALTYTKLAWLNGFKIEIDHPLVPKDLLPIRPLVLYEDKYDFLRTK